MKILAVGNSADCLEELGGKLRRLFPDAQIVQLADPLMAGKYAVHNKVDILLTEWKMKRMDGGQLIRFVRQEQPGVRAYLMGREASACRLPSVQPGDVAGYIPYSCSTGALAAILNAKHPAEAK